MIQQKNQATAQMQKLYNTSLIKSQTQRFSNQKIVPAGSGFFFPLKKKKDRVNKALKDKLDIKEYKTVVKFGDWRGIGDSDGKA